MLKEKLKQFYDTNKPSLEFEFNEATLENFFDFYTQYALSYYQFKITPFFLAQEARVSYKEATDLLLFFSNEDFDEITPIEANLYIICPDCSEKIFSNGYDDEIICDYCQQTPDYDEDDTLVQFNINENFTKSAKRDMQVSTLDALRNSNHPLAESPLSSNIENRTEGDLHYNDIVSPSRSLRFKHSMIQGLRDESNAN